MVAYELDFPSELEEVILRFNVTMLRKHIGDSSHIMPTVDVCIAKYFSYAKFLVDILDQKLRNLLTQE